MIFLVSRLRLMTRRSSSWGYLGVPMVSLAQRLALLRMPVTGSALADGKIICQAFFLAS